VRPLELTLDKCIQVLPGHLQLVEPAWSAMRRGYMTAGSATVLRLGTAGEGSDGLYHLPVALFDGMSPKTANRWAGAGVFVGQELVCHWGCLQMCFTAWLRACSSCSSQHL
jgi:hypothetical protein